MFQRMTDFARRVCPAALALPLLASFAGHGGRRHDGPMADVGASALRWLTGREAPLPGEPFV